MEYTHSRVLSPEGDSVWDGAYSARDQIASLPGLPDELRDTFAALAGSATRIGGKPWLRPIELTECAERLEFVSRKGCARGFLASLPAFLLVERSLDKFNTAHLERLGATEIQFPFVFSVRDERMQDLTAGYERDGRIFALAGESDSTLRLAYAADPGLFAWLQGARFRAGELPLTVASPMHFFRRYKSGETGPLTRVREYGITDVHAISTEQDAAELCCSMAKANRQSASFWVSNNIAQFIDVTAEFQSRYRFLSSQMARAAHCWTLVNVFARKPRYYSMRSGLVTDSGFGAPMLYNIQWDEENTKRFDFRTVQGDPIVILHSNALAASGLVCAILGKALAGLSPQAIPPEIAMSQITLMPLQSIFVAAAEIHARRLSDLGWRTAVRHPQRPGAAMRRARAEWLPAVGIIGAREAAAADLLLQSPFDGANFTEESFRLRYAESCAKCRPWRALPGSPNSRTW